MILILNVMKKAPLLSPDYKPKLRDCLYLIQERRETQVTGYSNSHTISES